MRSVFYIVIMVFTIVPTLNAEVGLTAGMDFPNTYRLTPIAEVGNDTLMNELPYDMTFKNPSKAVALSYFHTVIPTISGIAMFKNRRDWGDDDGKLFGYLGTGFIFYGIIIGPSIGQFYARTDGAGGIFARLGGALIMTGSGFLGLACALDAAFGGEGCSSAGFGALGLLFFGGAGLIIQSTIKNITTADDTARRHNQEVAAWQLSLSPYYHPETSSKGLSLSVRF